MGRKLIIYSPPILLPLISQIISHKYFSYTSFKYHGNHRVHKIYRLSPLTYNLIIRLFQHCQMDFKIT